MAKWQMLMGWWEQGWTLFLLLFSLSIVKFQIFCSDHRLKSNFIEKVIAKCIISTYLVFLEKFDCHVNSNTKAGIMDFSNIWILQRGRCDPWQYV